jgi:hypothetical protein
MDILQYVASNQSFQLSCLRCGCCDDGYSGDPDTPLRLQVITCRTELFCLLVYNGTHENYALKTVSYPYNGS